jgi:putative PD-(D/E)XK family protein DUF4420
MTNNPWSAIQKPSVDFNVRLVDEVHPLRLFWGVDAKSRYLFAYDAAANELPQKRSLPNLSGLEVYVVSQGTRGKLVLVLQNNSNWELFYALCSDLVRATASITDESAGSLILIRRLQRWQELLKRTRASILTPDQIKGLMGELLFLRDPLAIVFGYDLAVAAWRGPEDGPQDFAINETAVEVKCQSGGSKPMVRISSADQLSPQLPRGYLVVYTLAGQGPDELGSLSLNSLVSTIREDLGGTSTATRERFEDLLYMAGYLTREEYDDHRFSVVSVKSYQLADGFPRIVNSGLHAGIEFVSYSIRLEACASFQSKPEWWPASHEY